MNYFTKKLITKIINPKINIGAIDICDLSIKYIHINTSSKKIDIYSVPLKPGIVLNGKIVKQSEFSNALKYLRSKINAKNREIPVVVSISDANIYTQIITLPYINAKNEDEVIQLNMEMVSPIDMDKAYSGWQYIKIDNTDHKIILASFAEKDIVDPIIEAFFDSGFITVAIEQKSASLSRAIRMNEVNNFGDKPMFALDISSDGISFSIINNGSLMFNRFISWHEVSTKTQGTKISFSDFSNIIIEESHTVVNYYNSKFNDELKSIYLVADSISEKIGSVLAREFSVNIIRPNIKDYNVSPKDLTLFGAVLRGSSGMRFDNEINIAPKDVKREFEHEKILSFVSVWESLFSITFLVILLSMLASFVFLNNYTSNVFARLEKNSVSHNFSKLKELKDEAKKFNNNIDIVLKIKSQQKNFSNTIGLIYKDALANSVSIKRLYIQPQAGSVLINGYANSEEKAVDFKNALKSKICTNAKLSESACNKSNVIDLPLSGIVPNVAGGVLFHISISKF